MQRDEGGGVVGSLADTTRLFAHMAGRVGDRVGRVVISSGEELLLWGGHVGGRTLADGVLRSAAGRVPLPPAPIRPRAFATGIAIPGRFLVWGGAEIRGEQIEFYNDGASFDGRTHRWSRIPRAPIAPRRLASAVWTGSHVLLWGGDANDASRFRAFDDGAAYDPVNESWSPICAVGAPSPRHMHSAVWTGATMIVFGGAIVSPRGIRPLGDGGAYDPLAGSWRPLASAGAPAPRFGHDARWRAGRMEIVGGTDGQHTHRDGFAFHARGGWSSLEGTV